jgi:HAE1 family hydrophobic/amphiphilic exporter-1
MALNISAGAIRNPIPPIVLMLALIFAGLTAYFRLPINQLPGIDMPLFSVTVTQSGASPAEMETQIAQRLEAALSSVENQKRLMTTITPGAVSIMVELESNANLTRSIEDARDAVNRVRSDMPADIDEPIIQRINEAEEPIAYYAAEWPGKSERDLSWWIDKELSRELLAVRGIGGVQRLGGVDREIRVELDPAKMMALGVTASEISRQLRAQNVNLPGGRAEVGGQAQSIRTLGGAETVEQLAETRIVLADGRSVRLAELGDVTDSESEMSSVARYNGQPVISFLVQRAKGASEVQTFDAMVAALAQLEQTNPGVKFRLIGTPVEFVKGMWKSSMAALIEGALLAILVVLLILRDWRATLIAAAAIPLATIPTFAFMEVLGFTMNMITLIALGLVAGVLVDDAIVEIENIVRHMRMGKSAYQAALEAADEIGLAVVATAATIIAVFLPVSFMTGTTGQFFKEFGITVAIAVFLSLIVARLITPLMAAYFLKSGHAEKPPGPLMNTYRKALVWAVKRPFVAAFMGLGVFILSLVPVFTGLVPMRFIPELDNGTIALNVEFAPGTTLVEADAKMREISARSNTVEEVQGVLFTIGAVQGSVSSGIAYIQLVPREHRKRSAKQVEALIRPRVGAIPDIRASFLQFQGEGRGSDITLEFVGDDPKALEAAADALVAQMRTLPELADVKSSASLRRPEVQIRPRTEEAARLGVSSADLAAAIRIATGGDVDQSLAKFTLADRQIPIRVLLRPETRASVDTIQALRIRTGSGESVRLDAIADISFTAGEAAIERRDRQRKVTVGANVVQGEIGAVMEKIYKLDAIKSPPAGAALLAAGDTENMAEMVSGFTTAMLWGVLLIYGVLVLLFRDFFQPITILTALPLSVGGAFVGLMLTDQPLSLFVFIGFLMLMGIVTKNSILLVDFAFEQMHKGVSRNQALIEAGMKRARPIVMTTIAMSAGMIPAAAGWGVDGTLRQGMGVAVIGGLILSTMLSLVFVPAVFVLIDRLERVVRPLFSRLSTRNSDPRAHIPAE